MKDLPWRASSDATLRPLRCSWIPEPGAWLYWIIAPGDWHLRAKVCAHSLVKKYADVKKHRLSA